MRVVALRPALALCVLAIIFGISADSAKAAGISVAIDMASPVHLSQNATSIVVGNPSIADVYVQNERLIFIQGRSFGTTNLVALGPEGEEILNVPVTVTSGRGSTVTLQRGVSGRISYTCAGRCEPALMPGDDPEQFGAVLSSMTGKAEAAEQVASRGSQAQP